MPHTVIGLFADSPAAQRALTELAAAGFDRASAKDAADTGQPGRRWVLVETEGRDRDIQDILRRAGAESMDAHAAGSGAAQSALMLEPDRGATAESVPPRERHPHGGNWLREIVFGLNDGLVTTLVFIMAASALAQSHAALLLIALSEVSAGGVSMALGGYLSARTERDLLARRIATERHEIATEPEEERAELRDIYRKKGLCGSLLDRVVTQLTATDERWLQALVHDELGVIDNEEVAPWRQGLRIGASFVLGGLIPTLAVLAGLPQPWMQIAAYALTALTALGLGALKARYSLKGPVRNGLEFLAIVTIGTAAGGIIGVALHAA